MQMSHGGVYVKMICVNCGSNPGFWPEYLEAAREFGTLLVSNVCGYFDLFLSFLDHTTVREDFIRQEHRDLIAVSDAPRLF
jgi:predicted Rossmann-fold nucleotide-binding protein